MLEKKQRIVGSFKKHARGVDAQIATSRNIFFLMKS